MLCNHGTKKKKERRETQKYLKQKQKKLGQLAIYISLEIK